MARNTIAMQSRRNLAVVISDGRDGLHKATVRWTAPSWALLWRRRFPGTVTEVEIFGHLLLLYPRGAKGVSLPIDLAHITSVELAYAGLENFETLGPDLPRTVAEGDTAFFNVHDPGKAVVIRLKNERYARLVIEVEDPPATVAAIQRAIGEVADHV